MGTALADLIDVSSRVGGSASRNEKVAALADLLRRLAPDEIRPAVAFLSGSVRQGRIGLGPAALRKAFPDRAAPAPSLALLEVDRIFGEIARAAGPGSNEARVRRLADLLARATAAEQEFLVRLVLGELRQGALEGVMAAAIARAEGLPIEEVRRAVMLAGDLGEVLEALRAGGPAALERFALRVFRPILPMLASPAEDVGEALAAFGRAVFEDKLDGARIQVHRGGGEVRVYTRSLNEVTASVPEVVERARALPGGDLVLDGEAIALAPDGRPLPFQTTMRRFGRIQDVERLRAEIPIAPFWFDCLLAHGEPLIDRPGAERRAALLDLAGPDALVRGALVEDATAGEAFLAEALARGHEGVMAKSLEAPYEAGSRGSAWRKIKAVRTLDLVVLAVERGSGRRTGWLSNLHLGARDPAGGGFVMVGKTFKGLTDEVLAWQTARLREIAVREEDGVVHVRPELVVEIAIGDVQSSPRYPGGVALRFARVKGYRPDKRPEEADTIEAVRALLPGTRAC